MHREDRDRVDQPISASVAADVERHTFTVVNQYGKRGRPQHPLWMVSEGPLYIVLPAAEADRLSTLALDGVLGADIRASVGDVNPDVERQQFATGLVARTQAELLPSLDIDALVCRIPEFCAGRAEDPRDDLDAGTQRDAASGNPGRDPSSRAGASRSDQEDYGHKQRCNAEQPAPGQRSPAAAILAAAGRVTPQGSAMNAIGRWRSKQDPRLTRKLAAEADVHATPEVRSRPGRSDTVDVPLCVDYGSDVRFWVLYDTIRARDSLGCTGAESCGFHDRGDALSAANAQRGRAVTLAPPAKLVQEREQQPGAARADRMPERDRAAVWVDPPALQPEFSLHGKVLGGKRLVDLDHTDLVHPKLGSRQRFPQRRGRSDAHDLRRDSNDRPRQQPS